MRYCVSRNIIKRTETDFMERHRRSYCFFALIVGGMLFSSAAVAQMQKLRIADNHRFLVKGDSHPFVWIGDTNWFFAKLPPATIDSILDTRRAQGFTIMLVSCRESLYNGSGPGKLDAPNERWWAYLDEYVAKCEQKNLYVGITLGWWGLLKNNSAEALYDYGKWVGDRYKDRDNIVWLTLGEAGSYRRKDTLPNDRLRALVDGIRNGDSGDKLLTVHADYKRGTSISDDAILCDFNNWQTSQWCCSDDLPKKDSRAWTVWEAIAHDYSLEYDGKPKPTLDSEAWYENNKDFCGATAFNVRRRAYFTIFAGAFGHTYGAGGVWDGLSADEGCSRDALAAINYPGAQSMSNLSQFLHRLGDDFLKLRPNQRFVADHNSDNYDTHIQAAVANNRSFALVYSARDAAYRVNVSLLSESASSAIWYNPRANAYQKTAARPFGNADAVRFDPPGDSGPGNDWVLIIGHEQFVSQFPVK